jgi:hypothetical protein
MYTMELIQLHVDDMRKMAARTRVHDALPASARLHALLAGVLSAR